MNSSALYIPISCNYSAIIKLQWLSPQVHSSPEKVESRNILDILRSSLNDHAISGAENEVRYKLIIDPSEDGSLVRLLFSSGVLQRENTRVYVCSDFPGDAQLQKV